MKDQSYDDNNGGSEEVEDRLSSLPDFIIVDILSLLPLKSAAATSALSRQWRHLWTQTHRLDFSSDPFPVGRSSDSSDEFHTTFITVDHILRQLTSPVICTFRLNTSSFSSENQWDRCRSSLVESWIRQISGRNPKEVDVSLFGFCSNGPLICLPACVFECQSLVKLKLRGFITFELPVSGRINLINLKKLSMHLYDSCRELMGKLFKSCPLLEDLDLSMYLDEDEHLLDISAPYLERLKISMKGRSRGSEIVINAPELKEIDIDSSCSPSCRFVNNPSRLLNADIKAWHGRGRFRRRDQVLELLRGILSVKSLELRVGVFYLLHGLDEGVLPIFQNLTLLTISLYHTEDLNNLMPFLHCCPNLEALVLVINYYRNGIRVVKDMNWVVPDSVPACLLNKLKRIEINNLRGRNGELKFLQFILSNATVLEQLIVGVAKCDDGKMWKFCKAFNEIALYKEFKFCKNLFTHPRSSSTCEITFTGDCLSASSEDFKNGSPPVRLVPHRQVSKT